MKNTFMLKKNYEFKYVLSKGKYFSGEYIEAFFIKNKKEYNLLGIAISTKVGKAVKRNTIKRYIRESYKDVEGNITKGNSIVFLWKKNKNADDANYFEIRKDIENICNKAGII